MFAIEEESEGKSYHLTWLQRLPIIIILPLSKNKFGDRHFSILVTGKCPRDKKVITL